MTAHGAVPRGLMRARSRPHHHSVPSSTTSPSNSPTAAGTAGDSGKNRTARPGREALSTESGTPSLKAIFSQPHALDGPAPSTPMSVAPAAPAIPAVNDVHWRWTAGRSSSGASEGFNATATPYRTPPSTGFPCRCAIQPATSATSSSG